MYKQYQVTKTYDEYFSHWEQSDLNKISDEIKKYIYNKYYIKCQVFQRDGFICQNELCKSPKSKLTIHHTKFVKNNGKWSLKNCVTICKSCHQGYHKGAIPLTYNSMTYKIHKVPQFNWKQSKAEFKIVRKNNKHNHINIDWDTLLLLIKFLYSNKNDWQSYIDDDE